MVEPITMAVAGVAGVASATGYILGKLGRGNPKELIKVKKTPLHFIAVAGEAEPDELVEIAKAGEPVFINLKPLRTEPLVRVRFLKALNAAASSKGLELNEVVNELLVLTDGKQLMRVRTLTELRSQMDDPSAIDSALQAIAGS